MALPQANFRAPTLNVGNVKTNIAGSFNDMLNYGLAQDKLALEKDKYGLLKIAQQEQNAISALKRKEAETLMAEQEALKNFVANADMDNYANIVRADSQGNYQTQIDNYIKAGEKDFNRMTELAAKQNRTAAEQAELGTLEQADMHRGQKLADIMTNRTVYQENIKPLLQQDLLKQGVSLPNAVTATEALLSSSGYKSSAALDKAAKDSLQTVAKGRNDALKNAIDMEKLVAEQGSNLVQGLNDAYTVRNSRGGTSSGSGSGKTSPAYAKVGSLVHGTGKPAEVIEQIVERYNYTPMLWPSALGDEGKVRDIAKELMTKYGWEPEQVEAVMFDQTTIGVLSDGLKGPATAKAFDARMTASPELFGYNKNSEYAKRLGTGAGNAVTVNQQAIDAALLTNAQQQKGNLGLAQRLAEIEALSNAGLNYSTEANSRAATQAAINALSPAKSVPATTTASLPAKSMPDVLTVMASSETAKKEAPSKEVLAIAEKDTPITALTDKQLTEVVNDSSGILDTAYKLDASRRLQGKQATAAHVDMLMNRKVITETSENINKNIKDVQNKITKAQNVSTPNKQSRLAELAKELQTLQAQRAILLDTYPILR